MVTIKRYRNRKLYNTEQSRYVTLRDLVALLRQGQSLEVKDKETGADLTTHTLAMAVALMEETAPSEVAKLKLVEILRERPDLPVAQPSLTLVKP